MNTKTINLCSILSLPILAITIAPQSSVAAMASRVSVENKASQFDDVLGDASTSNKATGAKNDEMAEMIRRQRAALDTADKTANAKNTAAARAQNNQNLCDGGLRACMTEKCGKDFAKCSGDGDTDLGIKFDACRAKTECTGEEFRLFTIEIKADIAQNAQMALYNKTLECGNSYNACMAEQCGGDKYTKCLNNAAAVAATDKCKKIADDCRQSDTGLANRFGELIGHLRQDAEITIATDEKRLYEIRDKMRASCKHLGALFDERTFDCVYTVSFFAGDNQSTPMASRKMYAGATYDCTPEWFGVDVTTFKENAYRFTRSETAATSAFMGAGVGTAVGSITSGAIGRAIDTKKAKDAMEDAQREQNGGMTDKELEREKQKDLKAAAREQKKENRAARKSGDQTGNVDKNGGGQQQSDTQMSGDGNQYSQSQANQANEFINNSDSLKATTQQRDAEQDKKDTQAWLDKQKQEIDNLDLDEEEEEDDFVPASRAASDDDSDDPMAAAFGYTVD